jgi:hypothetical protein
MQFVRFIELSNDIYKKLYVRELIDCLLPIVNPTGNNIPLQSHKTKFHDLVFMARDNLAFLSQDQETKLMLEGLGLSNAFNSNFIGRLLVIFQIRDTRDALRNTSSDLADILTFFSTLRAFQQLCNSMETLIAKPRVAGLEANEASIEFEVLELGLKGFDLERLEAILPLIDTLFKQLCIVYEEKEASPRILYMDSGSGLIIALKGPEKIIDAIRKLFLAVWDKIRFKKYEDLNKKLETIDSSLEVLDKIKQKEASGSITPEDSARLNHLITDSVFGLFEKGTSLREIQKAETFENRKLLTDMVEVKYLTDKPKAEADTSPPKAS